MSGRVKTRSRNRLLRKLPRRIRSCGIAHHAERARRDFLLIQVFLRPDRPASWYLSLLQIVREPEDTDMDAQVFINILNLPWARRVFQRQTDGTLRLKESAHGNLLMAAARADMEIDLVRGTARFIL